MNFINVSSKVLKKMMERCCRMWFSRFKTGNRSLEDETRECRPIGLDSETSEAVVTENPTTTDTEHCEKFNDCHTIVLRQLKKIRKISVKNVPCLQRIANVSIFANHCMHDKFKSPFHTDLLLVMIK